MVLRAGVGKIDGNKERAAAGGKPVRAGDAGLGDGRGAALRLGRRLSERELLNFGVGASDAPLRTS